MPTGPASAKSKRRWGNIKESLKKQGKRDDLAEQIAVQTVDRRRAPRDESGSPRENAGMAGTADAPDRGVDAARWRKR